MKPIVAIALREWRSMFLSPLAWTLLAVLFAITSWMFSAATRLYQIQQMQFQAFGGGGASLTDSTVAPMLGNAAVLLLLISPLLTMRLIAEEKRRETWPAVASSPLSPMQILLGKYFGLLLFLAVTVGLLAIPPLLLFAYGSPDGGQIFSGLLGLFLVAATFGAVGLAASAATDNPIVAAVISFGVLLSLWIASWMGEAGGTDTVDQVLAYISLTGHYEKFLTGVISSADLAYFVIVSLLALVAARYRLMAERVRG
ncbi:MAG: ABC transporter permease [Magnetococcales bacterium]|nr:ABC transporter permease [Magnetococcales bacterium]MBF0156783.1 ABC transporter permease [Magnetococcales bacterium]